MDAVAAEDGISILATAAIGVAATLAVRDIDFDKIHLPTLWDVIAVAQFGILARASVDESDISDVSDVADNDKNDNSHRHHTIPIYLCGAFQQVTSSIPDVEHYQIHRDIAQLTVAADTSASFADKVLRLKSRRTKGIMALAETQEGRAEIAGVLEAYYRPMWWYTGNPEIGVAFSAEKEQYISGIKTSIPMYCSRYGRPPK